MNLCILGEHLLTFPPCLHLGTGLLGPMGAEVQLGKRGQAVCKVADQL